MEKVTGIGGPFFRARDPKGLAKWYNDHLGISAVLSDYARPAWQRSAGSTLNAPFPGSRAYFGNTSRLWMLNFQVKNLDAMAEQIVAAGREAKADSERDSNGRFARVGHAEGNPIELWRSEERDAD